MADKIKLLIANDHIGYGGQIHGAARLFLLWATHLDPTKFDVTVCILRAECELGKLFRRQGIKTVFLGKSKYDPTTLVSFLKLIHQEKIDLMHLQSYGATTFGRLAKVVTGIPVVVHFHDTNPYYPWSQRASDRVLSGLTDAYLAVSESVKDWWSQRCGLSPEQITVLYNCTSLETFAAVDPQSIATERARLGIRPGEYVVGTVTRLHACKGIHYLLEAAPAVLEAFPQTKFVIVGDGPIREELELLAIQLGVRDRVVFTGFVERVPPVLGTFDIKVLASITEGGSPLPVLEAMAMGKPIIATDLVEILQDGINGLVIPPRDSPLLAEKLVHLLRNRDEARRLGENAKCIAAIYDVNAYVRKLEQIYEDVLVKHRGGTLKETGATAHAGRNSRLW